MDDDRKENTDSVKKEYFPPKIVHSQTLTARATVCNKSDTAQCAPGPIQS